MKIVKWCLFRLYCQSSNKPTTPHRQNLAAAIFRENFFIRSSPRRYPYGG